MFEYAWVRTEYIQPPRGKLVKKVPMRQEVLDENNRVYKYWITPEGKVEYFYMYIAVFEDLND